MEAENHTPLNTTHHNTHPPPTCADVSSYPSYGHLSQ